MLIKDGDGASSIQKAKPLPKVENENARIQANPQLKEDGTSKVAALNITASVVKATLNLKADQTEASRVARFASPPNATTSVEAVRNTFHNEGPEAAARELANQLRSGDDTFDQDVMASLSREREFAFIVNAAGGEANDPNDKVSPADRDVIARAFGSAYDSGRLSADTVGNLVEHNAQPGQNLPITTGTFKNEYTANFMLATGSTQALRDFTYSTLNAVKDKPQELQHFLRGAAYAMAGDTGLLQDVLRDIGSGRFGDSITMDNFVNAISRDPLHPDFYQFTPDRTSSLVRVLNAAAQLPLGEEKLALFQAAAKSEDATQNTTGGADALIRLYSSDAQQITDHYLDEALPQRNERLKDFSTFLQNTLFNNKATNKQELIDSLSEVADSYKTTNDLYHLGNLGGAVENGFSFAVKANEDRRAATKDFLDFVIGLTPVPGGVQDIFKKVLGDLPQEVAEGLSSKASDEAKGAALDWLTDQLTKDNKILFWKTGQEIKSRNDLDDVVRATFGIPTLADPDPSSQRDNESIIRFEAGLTFARDAVRD